MTARELPEAEWYRVAPLYKREFRDMPPLTGMGKIYVLEEDGEIVGFTTLQWFLHIEPTWIDPSATSFAAARTLMNEVVKSGVQQAVATTRDPKIIRAMKTFGMELLEGLQVLRWTRSHYEQYIRRPSAS